MDEWFGPLQGKLSGVVQIIWGGAGPGAEHPEEAAVAKTHPLLGGSIDYGDSFVGLQRELGSRGVACMVHRVMSR